jgi:DNA-binding winged helix-turn-helix (wHTH) protein
MAARRATPIMEPMGGKMKTATVGFGDCHLDLERRELRRAGAVTHLTPKAYELLTLLVRSRPRALAKREILTALWPETCVSDGSLAVVVAELRRALDDDARTPRYLRTVHRYGLAFCGAVAEEQETKLARPLARLLWGTHDFGLGPGEAVIGRDPACDVTIGVPSLSRRHARIRLAPGAAILEDLGSKNGCRVNGARLAGPLLLRDGDDIRLGDAALRFRWMAEVFWDTPTADLAGATEPLMSR